MPPPTVRDLITGRHVIIFLRAGNKAVRVVVFIKDLHPPAAGFLALIENDLHFKVFHFNYKFAEFPDIVISILRHPAKENFDKVQEHIRHQLTAKLSGVQPGYQVKESGKPDMIADPRIVGYLTCLFRI